MQEAIKNGCFVLPSGEKILALHHYAFEDGMGESYCAKLDTGCMLMAVRDDAKITCYKKSFQGGSKHNAEEPLHESYFSTLAAFSRQKKRSKAVTIKIKIFSCVAFFVTLSGVIFLFSTRGDSEVVYRGQTKEEAFYYVASLIKYLPEFKTMPYTVSLPEQKDFEEVYQTPALLEKKAELLRKIFYEEVYDASKFDATLEILRQTEDVVKQALKKLAILEKNWGFKIKKRYDIVLTVYGTGGEYRWEDPAVGTVLVKADTRKTVRGYTKTILHEMVHIGIQETIVNKYNLSHWETERLVDLICSTYLKDLLPEYGMQKSADTKIDEFISEEAIVKNLPAAIERFVAQYPRDGQTIQ